MTYLKINEVPEAKPCIGCTAWGPDCANECADLDMWLAAQDVKNMKREENKRV